MAKLNTTTKTKEAEKGANKAIVRLVNSEKAPELVAFVNVVYNGVFMTNLAVRQKEDKDAYIQYPAVKRVDKEGNAVLNEAGKPIYDTQYGPATPQAHDEIQNMVFEAVNEALNAN